MRKGPGTEHPVVAERVYRRQPFRFQRIVAQLRSKLPLIIISRAKEKTDAMEGLERWKLRHPDVAALLEGG